MSENIRLALTAGWLLYLVVLVIWIVLQKRSPVATLSWILSLAAFPVIGLVIYYVFGPQRLKRSRLRRVNGRALVELEHAQLRALGAAIPPSDRTRQLATLVQRAGSYQPITATEATLLIDGQATFEALFEAIAAAREHIHLEYYIYEPDQIGTALRDLLVARAAAGVKVRLLVDALGSAGITRRYMRPLLAAGGELAFFHGARLRRLRPLINMRTHRKIVVCDGEVGFVGGINITDDGDERVRGGDAFRDSHMRLRGNAVQRLQQVFLEDWFYSTGTLADCPQLAPTMASGELVVQVIASGPDTELAPIQRAMVAAIGMANHRIWLATPYFIPDEAALFALVSAALRGIDVRILVPRKADSWLVTRASRSYFDELTRVGARIYEYEPRMLHAKTLVVDDRYSLIGTANFDIRSFRLNFEILVLLYDRGVAERFAAQFERDLLASSMVARERNLPWHERLAEAAARVCAPVL